MENIETPQNLPPTPTPPPLEAIIPSTPPKSRKLLIAVIFSLIFLGGISVFYFYFSKQKKTSSTTQSQNSQSGLTTYSQKLGQLAGSLVGIKDPSPTPTVTVSSPVPSPISTSFDQILQSGSYQKKDVKYTNNDGTKVDSTNLKIKVPGIQSFLWIKPALAAELQILTPIYLQNPTVETLDTLAKTLGIQAKATKPEPNNLFHLEYLDPKAKLIYSPTAGFGTLHYEASIGEGSLPTTLEAQAIANSTLKSLNIPYENLKVSTVPSSIASEYENFASVHDAQAVNYYRQINDHSVVFSDSDSFSNTPTGNFSSPEITVLVTGGGKIARLTIANYGQRLGNTPVSMNSRTLEEAVTELKTYGGHIRSTQEQEGQRTYFACADNRCTVHDATITKAELGYHWNNNLPSLSYSEISDNQPRAFEYLTPVWIFEGTGLMDKAKTDESGRLLPNIDKSNPEMFYQQKVKFISTVPAFAQTNDENLLGLNNYTLTKEEGNNAKVKFDTQYLFPNLTEGRFANAEPRMGVKYRLLILLPDSTYTIINGYKQEVYSGEVTFDIGSVKGTVTTYLELSDYSNLIEKRTLLVE